MKSLIASGDVIMASITIRNIDDELKASLRLQAARHEVSMEEEVRRILRRALNREAKGLGSQIHQRFSAIGGIDLELHERSDLPRAADLES
jgi:plasmid stability protein